MVYILMESLTFNGNPDILANVSETFAVLSTFFMGLFGALVSEIILLPPSKTELRPYRRLLFWVTACFAGAVAWIVAPQSLPAALLVGSAIPLIQRSVLKPTARQAEREAVEKVEQAERAVKEEPDKTRPYWDLSSARLELYIQRNLSQTRSIFWITVVVLLAGFSLICYGVWKSFEGAKIESALLTTASGVLTEFIAATFLVIYKSTLSQASGFVQALEKINGVGMALHIVDSIAEVSGTLRDKTRADLAIKILDAFPSPGRRTSQKKKGRAETV